MILVVSPDQLEVTQHPLAVLNLAAAQAACVGPIETGGVSLEPDIVRAPAYE